MMLPIEGESSNHVKLEECLGEIKNWMAKNKLQLNESKTEVLVFSKQLKNQYQSDLNFAGESIHVPTNDSVRNLGFYFDSRLSMEQHVKKVCQACHYHLKNIGKIRNLIDTETTHMLIHSFITSRLDYCNSLLVRIPAYLLDRLQKLQNKAAKIVLKKKQSESSINVLRDLHWLPIKTRIDFKIASHVFKALNGLAPSYLEDLVHIYQPLRTLRSSSGCLLETKRVNSKLEERAFSFYAPKVWNALSLITKQCENYDSFKKHLKTEYFKKCYEA